MQSKLTDFGQQNVEPNANEASKKVSKKPSNNKEANAELTANKDEMNNSPGDKAEILGSNKELKVGIFWKIRWHYDSHRNNEKKMGECQAFNAS